MIKIEIKGKEVKVGDWVGFKADIEQSGKIVEIHRNGMLTLYNEDGFKGDYIGGEHYTDVEFIRCWL
jgi:hypothetical protein